MSYVLLCFKLRDSLSKAVSLECDFTACLWIDLTVIGLISSKYTSILSFYILYSKFLIFLLAFDSIGCYPKKEEKRRLLVDPFYFLKLGLWLIDLKHYTYSFSLKMLHLPNFLSKSWFSSDMSQFYEIYFFKKCVNISWNGNTLFYNQLLKKKKN